MPLSTNPHVEKTSISIVIDSTGRVERVMQIETSLILDGLDSAYAKADLDQLVADATVHLQGDPDLDRVQITEHRRMPSIAIPMLRGR